MNFLSRPLRTAIVALSLVGIGHAQQVDPQLFSGLSWRSVGPFRGGRVAAVTGAVGKPGVYFMGMPMGGVWRTTNAGVTWEPVFDAVKGVSSVGSVQVAPSDSNIVYVGTGDFSSGGCPSIGNGMYKSTDGGRTWAHIGLDGTDHIPSMVVDPTNPDHVLVAARGDSRKGTEQRGIFRTTDGGKTWKQVLYVDDKTGAERIAYAHDVPDTLYATTVKVGSGSKLYRSTDRGATWKEVTGEGLPSISGRTCVAVAPKTNAQRIFLTSNSGLFRSDDAGAHWTKMGSGDRRVSNGQGGYNCGVYVNSANPDIVYLINTCSYISRDGGVTFTGFKGAPGGDDPQQMWLDPTDPDRMIFGVDQGATISMDGGRSWSNWYNQATAQVYHIAVDNQWPYWIYATQQDSGAVSTCMRGNYGEITPLDWHPHPGYEFGSLAIDPRDPNISYCGSDIGGIIRVDKPSGQYIDVSPVVEAGSGLRHVLNQPLLFNPNDPRELLAGFQFLMSTTDGGKTWKKLSPDLGAPKETPKPTTPTTPAKPPTTGNAVTDDDDDEDQNENMDDEERELRQQARGGGSIESFCVSTADPQVLWAGLNNGGVHVTKDRGKTWSDVTPTGLPQGSDISGIDASHHEAGEAYIAVDAHNRGDYAPHVYRTRDFGKTWTKIVNGIPGKDSDMSFARVIKSDPVRKGLLFLCTESFVYVSFDDGDHWQSLALNQPNTSYRDMVIKGNDLVVGTYGRSFWILDDISPLREVTGAIANQAAHLFKPGNAVRVRRNVNGDTPYPPEVTHADNPPLGAVLYYWLAKPATKVSIEIADKTGRVWRHLSSDDVVNLEPNQHPIPEFWKEVVRPLPNQAGMWRVNWNLLADNPPATSHGYGINANPFGTPQSPEGPLVPPGDYTVTLKAGDQTLRQVVKVVNDPRSRASAADLRAQWGLTSKLYDAALQAWGKDLELKALREQVKARLEAKPAEAATKALEAFQKKLEEFGTEASAQGGRRQAFATSAASYRAVYQSSLRIMDSMEFGDSVPTQAATSSANKNFDTLKRLDASWKKLVADDLAALNATLTKLSVQKITAPTG
ncbi:MAG: glycoside hydrolase [Armatimonadetes bacterium]|nr:glycoside hydrolase [Armatimonadota bacterium]